MSMAGAGAAGEAAEAEVDDLIAREVASVLSILSLQSNPLKESPEAALAATAAAASSATSAGGAVSIELQRLEWLPEARTLRLSAYPEVAGLTAASSLGSGGGTSSTDGLTRAQQLLLAPPLTLELFFPESLADQPLCFGSTDAAALVAERVNRAILPLERSSLLYAVSKITGIIKQEVDSIWPPSPSPSPSPPSAANNDDDSGGGGYLGGFQRRLAAHLQAHPKASDLLLSFLSMAKPHHPSVRFPLPRFFYRGPPGKDAVDQPALHAALAAIPPLPTLLDARGGPPLPFASCVLLHHLFFRSTVSLLDPPVPSADTDDHGDGDDPFQVRRLLQQAGVAALPRAEQPAHVFVVAHAADARFTRPAQRHGTRVGFHGSSPSNFFSITALGLRNLSGTRGMKNGAAFGEGVYLASHLGVAQSFGDWGTKVWPHSAFGVAATEPGGLGSSSAPTFGYQVIALCEFLALDRYTKRLVAGPPSSTSSSSGGRPAQGSASGSGESEYHVIEEDAHLVVRLLLLFEDPAMAAARCRRPPHGSPARVSSALPPAAAGRTAAQARQLHPQQQQQQQQQQQPPPWALRPRRGKLDVVLSVIRALCFVVALVLLLDGLEKLLVKSGRMWHGHGSRGGRPRGR